MNPLNFLTVRNISSTTLKKAGWARNDHASSTITHFFSRMFRGFWMRFQILPMSALTNGTASSGSSSSPDSSK